MKKEKREKKQEKKERNKKNKETNTKIRIRVSENIFFKWLSVSLLNPSFQLSTLTYFHITFHCMHSPSFPLQLQLVPNHLSYSSVLYLTHHTPRRASHEGVCPSGLIPMGQLYREPYGLQVPVENTYLQLWLTFAGFPDQATLNHFIFN